jgi:hypothetical protein
MSELSWRMFFIRNLITGKSGIITKETATTALLHNYYSNEKISKKLNFNFTSIHKSINHTGAKFLAENKKAD